MRDVAIVGGGPSGLMAAERLAQGGCRVTLYDRMPSLARKFLMAGHGGLNLTHSEPLEHFLAHYGTAEEWLAPHVRAFPPDALRAWCMALGQETFVGSSGRVFPRAMKAAPLLRAWLQRLEGLGVRYAGQHRFQGFDGDALRFTDARGETVLVRADATLLAMGGASWPRLGSDGGWVEILAASGVEIAPLRPANGGFTVPWSEHFRARFAGVPLKPVALMHPAVTGGPHRGELMITAQGIEGGAVYAVSAPLREAIAAQGTTTLTLDLRPNVSLEELARKLSLPRGGQSFSNHMRKAGFPPLVLGLLRETRSADALAAALPLQLGQWLKALPIPLTGTTGLARAISTAGGIRRGAVDDRFMLRARPGTFATGEMLDWEAPTGGYLLQGCFSLGVAAADGMLRYLQHDGSIGMEKPRRLHHPSADRDGDGTTENLYDGNGGR